MTRSRGKPNGSVDEDVGAEQAVAEAMRSYEASQELDAEARKAARRDFTAFYLAARRSGLLGLYLDFSGCPVCGRNADVGRLIRILVSSPALLSRTGGRPLAALLCAEHHAAIQSNPHGPRNLADAAVSRLQASGLKGVGDAPTRMPE